MQTTQSIFRLKDMVSLFLLIIQIFKAWGSLRFAKAVLFLFTWLDLYKWGLMQAKCETSGFLFYYQVLQPCLFYVVSKHKCVQITSALNERVYAATQVGERRPAGVRGTCATQPWTTQQGVVNKTFSTGRQSACFTCCRITWCQMKIKSNEICRFQVLPLMQFVHFSFIGRPKSYRLLPNIFHTTSSWIRLVCCLLSMQGSQVSRHKSINKSFSDLT